MLEHMSPWEYQTIRRDPRPRQRLRLARLPQHPPRVAVARRGVRRAAARGGSVARRAVRARPRVRGAVPGRRGADRVGRARVSVWRFRHYKVVARVIGDEVVGTQGTPVELLGGLIKNKLYPELWQVRNDLTARAQGGGRLTAGGRGGGARALRSRRRLPGARGLPRRRGLLGRRRISSPSCTSATACRRRSAATPRRAPPEPCPLPLAGLSHRAVSRDSRHRTCPDSTSASGHRRGRRRTTRPRSRTCARRSRAATSTRSTSSSTSRRRSTATRAALAAALAPLRPLAPAAVRRRRLDDRLGVARALPRAPRPPRLDDADQGHAAARRARASPRPTKDRAEHVMIVDLERNDLSRVCEPGSVRWPELMAERELAGVDAPRLDRRGHGCARTSASPSCSRRRSPAARSRARRRSPPSTTSRRSSRSAAARRWARSARLRPNGDLDLALTIRTFAIAEGPIHLWVGGGIVWDSEPEAEIEESWVKARPLLDALEVAASHDAARARRRGPRPRRPGRAGRARGRRGVPPRPRRLRDAARLRRRAVPARVAPRPARRRRASGSASSRPTPTSAASSRRSRSAQPGEPDAALRLYRTAGRERAGVAAAARARERAAAATSRSCARAGSRLVSLLGVARRGSVAARRRQVDELRGEHGGRGGGAARAAPTTPSSSRDGRPRARGPGDEPLVAARLDALHAVARPRHPRRRHARDAARARARARLRGRARGASRSPSCAGADEAFTSSSVRELMPVVELDGAPIPRGEAAATLQAALRRSGATLSAMAEEKLRLGGMALRERRARARPDLVGVRGPPPRRVDQGRGRAQAADRQHDREPVPARPGAPARGDRGPARAEAAPARGEAAVRAAAHPRRDARRARSASASSAARGSRPSRRSSLSGLLALTPALLVAARQRSRRVPRRRAHLDRHATSTTSRARASTSAAART